MKLLIVKTSSLGDIIQTFPVLDYLRCRFPDGQIDWVVESSFAELVSANPQVNRVLTIDSKNWRQNLFKKQSRLQIADFRRKLQQVRYDVLFDLQGNVKSGVITSLAKARKKVGFGWKTVPEWPNALWTSFKVNPAIGNNIRGDYLEVVKRYFNDPSPHIFQSVPLKLDPLQEQKLADLFASFPMPTLVCPSSAWPNKCISEEMLIKLLTDLNCGPYWFVWGNLKEKAHVLSIASHFAESLVLEKISLPLLQHVMAKCQLVVAMDSLPLHLCATTLTPTLSFFGPSSAKKYAPIGNQHLAIQGKCPYGVSFEKRCPKLRTCPTGSCLKVAENIDGWAEAAKRSGTQLGIRHLL